MVFDDKACGAEDEDEDASTDTAALDSEADPNLTGASSGKRKSDDTVLVIKENSATVKARHCLLHKQFKVGRHVRMLATKVIRAVLFLWSHARSRSGEGNSLFVTLSRQTSPSGRVITVGGCGA